MQKGSGLAASGGTQKAHNGIIQTVEQRILSCIQPFKRHCRVFVTSRDGHSYPIGE